MNNIARIRTPIGLAVLFLGIMACGMGASLAPAITESPLAPTESPTAISVPAPTATYPSRPTPTASATPTVLTPAPDIQSGDTTAIATPTLTWTHTPSRSPTNSPTLLPPSPTPTETWTPSPVVETPEADPQYVGGTDQAIYRYRAIGPAQPDLSQPCPGCPRAPGYIVGRVVDADGNPLVGVRLVCYNDWHRYPIVGTKGSGEYDFPILQAEATWYVVILDETDQPLSLEVPVYFDPGEACWYRLDWQRID